MKTIKSYRTMVKKLSRFNPETLKGFDKLDKDLKEELYWFNASVHEVDASFENNQEIGAEVQDDKRK